MRNNRTFLRGAAVVMLAGALALPAAAFARGGVARGGGHGPVFGFHHGPIVAHRPFRPIFAPRVPGRFANAWRLHRFAHRRGNNGNGNGIGDAGYAGGGYYPSSTYDPGVTGTVAAPGPYVYAPPAAPSERVGCVARGYEVASESGGIARVTVTRC